MNKYKIIVAIDKNMLPREAKNKEIASAIEQELGWIEGSGIKVKSVEKIENRKPKKPQLKEKDLPF